MSPLPGRLMLLALLLFSGAAQAETAIPALINDDEVRVRAEPSAKGAYVGVLYRNMLVTVLDQTATEQKIGDESHRWYKVRSEEFEGWTYGRYVSFDVPDQPVDTYQGSGDLEWFRNAMGEDGYFHPEMRDPGHLSTEQYRNLINAFEADTNPYARNVYLTVLGGTVYKRLSEHPDDPKYAYLKKKLYSDGFVLEIVDHLASPKFQMPDSWRTRMYLPRISDKTRLMSALETTGLALMLASDDLRDDEEVVLAAVNMPARPNYVPLGYASDRLRGNADIVLAATKKNARAIYHADHSLKSSVDFFLIAADGNYKVLFRAPREMQSNKAFTSFVANYIKTEYSDESDLEIRTEETAKLFLLMRTDKEAVADVLEFLYNRTKEHRPRNRNFYDSSKPEGDLDVGFWFMFPRALWNDEEFVKIVSLRMNKYKQCSFYIMVGKYSGDKNITRRLLRVISKHNKSCRRLGLRVVD